MKFDRENPEMYWDSGLIMGRELSKMIPSKT